MLYPWTLDLALAWGEAVPISPLVFSDLSSLLGGPREHCKVAENFEIPHGVSFAAN